MQNNGRDRKEVLEDLERILAKDPKYDDGKILSSMCTKPQSIARIAHQMFLSSNLGDPGLFKGSRRLEQEIIYKLAYLLKNRTATGFIVSGGTEANLLALWAARNKAKVNHPELILPESAHFSFDKICNLLNVRPIRVELDKDYRVLPEIIESHINSQTIAMVGTVGTSELGAVDPIAQLSKIAFVHSVHLHVDAAFGGLVIPFLGSSAQDDLSFDFRLEGVKSITVDPHKMGMSTIPAGGVLFKDQTLLDCIKTEAPYLTETLQYTLIGTRSAASTAATWAVFESLGFEGFKKTIKRCMALTNFLSKEIEKLDFQLVTKPTLNIVAFRTSNSKKTVENLQKLGWFVSYIPRLDCLRVIIMPHLRKRHLVLFLRDLQKME